MSNLQLLAQGCANGACNPHGIINSLAVAIKDVPFGRCAESVELRMIIGQLSYLVGESAGPTEETVRQYMTNLDAQPDRV